jgi:hypothetical protein
MLENPGRKSDNLQLAHLVSYLAGYWLDTWLDNNLLGLVGWRMDL